MGIFGTFVKGAVTGVVGLGVLSWLYSALATDKSEETESDEED